MIEKRTREMFFSKKLAKDFSTMEEAAKAELRYELETWHNQVNRARQIHATEVDHQILDYMVDAAEQLGSAFKEYYDAVHMPQAAPREENPFIPKPIEDIPNLEDPVHGGFSPKLKPPYF